MYINFWYPAILGSELTNEPVKVRMLSQNFVLFRDTGGNAQCLSNTCVHRGGSLADGKIKGDCIECPYHGWQYTGEGQCHRIPSLGPKAKIPGRTRVDAYPVQEKYGVVFAFLGDLPENERPPMMKIPEFDDDRWRATWINLQAPFNYERSIENGLDPAHNEFVHPIHGYSGENAEYKVGNLRLVGDGKWGPGFFHTFKSPPAETAEWRQVKDASDTREAGSGTIGPNHMWTYIRYAPGKAMHQYLYECPIDEGNVNIFLVNLRNQLIDPDRDQMVNDRNWTVISQDLAVLSKLSPTVTPPTNTKEFMVPADKPILMYREKLAEWDHNGWRIDSEAVNRNRDKVAYAVPSPARRRDKGWVIDPIPLIPATVVAKHQVQSAS